jgi:hypothetical protein
MRLGHHEGRGAAGLGERLDDKAIGFLERQPERLVVDGLEILRTLHQALPDAVALGPALDRLNAIRRQHRLSIMPLQAIAQDEGVGEFVVTHLVAVDHLRLHLHVGVEREQRVVDQIAMGSSDLRRHPDRIDHLEVGMHHRAHRCRRALRDDRKRPRYSQRCDSGGQTSAYQTLHSDLLFECIASVTRVEQILRHVKGLPDFTVSLFAKIGGYPIANGSQFQ